MLINLPRLKMALAAVFLSGSLYLFASPQCFAASWKVIEVREGDLLVVQREGVTRKVRLYGVVCPVKGQPFHQDARMITNFLSKHKNVEIIPVFGGSDGNAKALVRVDGTREFLNERLLGYGMAWVKPSECNATTCAEWRKLEGLARDNRIGLWVDPFAVAPWEWEKARRLEIFRQGGESPRPPE